MRCGAHSLSFVLAALAPLGAQSLKEGLASVPADAAQIEVYRDAATLDARFAATLGSHATPGPNLVGIYGDLDLPPAARAAGPVLRVEFPGKEALAQRFAYWLPAKDFKAFTRKLGAVPAQGLARAKRKAGTFYFAKAGAFALASQDAELLKAIRAAKTPMGAALEPLLPWLADHDVATVLPPAAARKALAAAAEGLDQGKNPGLAALKPFLKPLLDEAGASVAAAAVGAAFPPDGTIRGQAKAFFKPGSPLAERGSRFATPQGHPLEGLSPVGFVLGLGGPLPRFALPAAPVPGVAPEVTARLAALQAEQARNLRGMAFTLGVPAAPGAPLLGATRWLLRVDDPALYFKNLPDLMTAQNPILAALGFGTKVELDVLPGVPSCTSTLTFDSLAKSPLPPAQLKMALTLLFGSPDRILFSAAKADDHTILFVLGDAPALKAALAGFGPGFQVDPGVKAVDALLPAAAPWRLYLNLGNARDLVQTVLDSFAPGKQTLPAVPTVPPVGLTLLLDGSGVALDGAVVPETLAAILAFSKAVQPAKGTLAK